MCEGDDVKHEKASEEARTCRTESERGQQESGSLVPFVVIVAPQSQSFAALRPPLAHLAQTPPQPQGVLDAQQARARKRHTEAPLDAHQQVRAQPGRACATTTELEADAVTKCVASTPDTDDAEIVLENSREERTSGKNAVESPSLEEEQLRENLSASRESARAPKEERHTSPADARRVSRKSPPEHRVDSPADDMHLARKPMKPRGKRLRSRSRSPSNDSARASLERKRTRQSNAGNSKERLISDQENRSKGGSTTHLYEHDKLYKPEARGDAEDASSQTKLDALANAHRKGVVYRTAVGSTWDRTDEYKYPNQGDAVGSRSSDKIARDDVSTPHLPPTKQQASEVRDPRLRNRAPEDVRMPREPRVPSPPLRPKSPVDMSLRRRSVSPQRRFSPARRRPPSPFPPLRYNSRSPSPARQSDTFQRFRHSPPRRNYQQGGSPNRQSFYSRGPHSPPTARDRYYDETEDMGGSTQSFRRNADSPPRHFRRASPSASRLTSPREYENSDQFSPRSQQQQEQAQFVNAGQMFQNLTDSKYLGHLYHTVKKYIHDPSSGQASINKIHACQKSIRERINNVQSRVMSTRHSLETAQRMQQRDPPCTTCASTSTSSPTTASVSRCTRWSSTS